MKSNTLSWNEPDSLVKLVAILRENKVILAPSDTVWGLCGAVTPELFAALDVLKVRNDKPYLILARDLEVIEQYAILPQGAAFKRLAAQCWPGPLTLLLKARKETPGYLVAKAGTIAFRIPQHEGLQRLLAAIPLLLSTSANISGQPVPLFYDDIAPSIKSGVGAIILPEPGNERQSGVPSTILDLSQEEPVVVREGAFSKEVLENVLKD